LPSTRRGPARAGAELLFSSDHYRWSVLKICISVSRVLLKVLLKVPLQCRHLVHASHALSAALLYTPVLLSAHGILSVLSAIAGRTGRHSACVLDLNQVTGCSSKNTIRRILGSPAPPSLATKPARGRAGPERDFGALGTPSSLAACAEPAWRARRTRTRSALRPRTSRRRCARGSPPPPSAWSRRGAGPHTRVGRMCGVACGARLLPRRDPSCLCPAWS